MVDTMFMLEAALALPEQFARAAEAPSPLNGIAARRFSSVLIAGMGGSGIVGDLAKAIAWPSASVPIVSIKSDTCPAFVDSGSLVIISSFSGDTAETLSVMNQALERGALVVTVSSGGQVAALAQATDSPSWLIADKIPCPRAGLAALSVPVLRTLDQLGLCEPLGDQMGAAARQLEIRRAELEHDDNPAARLARRIGRRIPLIYGAGALGEAAATRWKSEFNENPKVPAFVGVVPELTHNEICGWAQHGDMTRQVFFLVQLRHSFEGPRNSAAMELVAEVTDEVVGDVHQLSAEGTGPLAQFFDLVITGDFVSLHMALAEGIDPGPVPILDDIKQQLSA